MPFLTLPEVGHLPALMLRYETWGDPQIGRTLVLVHELGGSVESFRDFVRHLSQDYFVIAYDQRCAGLSEEPVSAFSLDDLADDMVRLADALDLPEFDLMGLAMGAVVALHFVRSHPDRVRRLVLCDGTAAIDSNSSRYVLERASKIRQEGMRNVALASLQNSFRGLLDSEPPAYYLRYRDQFIATSPQGYVMHSEALAAMDLKDEDFARVTCPTLVATGRNDFIWPPEVGQALANRLPNAVFEVVENAAHFPPLQQGELFSRRMLQFLRAP